MYQEPSKETKVEERFCVEKASVETKPNDETEENSTARANSSMILESMKCCLLFDWGQLHDRNTKNKQKILLFLLKQILIIG